MLLLSNELNSVSLDWRGSRTDEIVTVLRRLQHCGALEVLQIRNVDAEFDLETSVVTLADSALQLKVVQLPASMVLRPRVWESLQRLNRLSEIACNITLKVIDPTQRVHHSSLDFDMGFNSLTQFTCPLAVEGVAALLSGSCLPPLTNLYLSIHDATNYTSTFIVLDLISRGFHHLQSLRLIFLANEHGIVLDDLLPVTNLTALTQLEITSDAPTALTDDNYEEIAFKMPQLQKVSLCPDPNPVNVPPATIKALGHFAKHCRNLTLLRLYVDTTPESLPTNTTYLTPFPTCFKTLSLGLSLMPGGKIKEVVQCLSRFLIYAGDATMKLDRSYQKRHRAGEHKGDVQVWYNEAEKDWNLVLHQIRILSEFIQAIRIVVEEHERPPGSAEAPKGKVRAWSRE